MTLPQHIVYGVGGEVSVTLRDQPQSVTVSVYDGNGTLLVNAATANISTINTLANAAYTRGTTAINVASNVGMAVGSTAWLQDDPEEILIRSVSGGTISLRRPLMTDHVANAVVEGTRVSYTVNSAVANVLFWDGRCEWVVDGSLQAFTAIECTKYPMPRLASAQDLYDIEPKIYQLLDCEADLDRLLDLGMERVLSAIALRSPDQRVRVYTGSSEFRHATALAALTAYWMRQPGDVAKDLWDRYSKELDGEIAKVCQLVPRDVDQDGVVEASDKIAPRTIVLRRA